MSGSTGRSIGGYAVVLIMALGPGSHCIQAEGQEAACPEGEKKCQDGGVTNPHLKHGVRPKYPARARREHVEGSVTFAARVETNGSVSVLKIVRCTKTGYGFEAAARDALKKWRYEPGTKNGEPVAVEFTVAIDFSLE